MANVYIVAGGPGDPELITLKGKKTIDKADIIFSSTRFFPDEMFSGKKAGCTVFDQFEYSYEEKIEIVCSSVAQGKVVAFVTMGDPYLYGMTRGLGDRLDKAGIEYEIIPGVSAVNACCSIIKRSMTGIGVANTAVCTTYRDRPDSEEYLKSVASLKSSVALFMSVDRLDFVCDIFKTHYPISTPVVVISEATREKQKIVRGTLDSISGNAKKENVRDGLILIGEFIDKEYDYNLERRFLESKKRESNK
jgi:precorrin-4/cobalt-precorrin-4 C11-methyltransferase